MTPQQTLGAVVPFTGVGLHSGLPVSGRLEPASQGTGLWFQRHGAPAVAARLDSVADGLLATTLGLGAAAVSTVEHLLAALWAHGIDNALVHLEGPELPALDGSARPWSSLLAQAGCRTQAAPACVLGPRRTLQYREGERSLTLDPCAHLVLDVQVQFPHPAIGTQRIELRVDGLAFDAELAWARTFGFAEQVGRLRAQGRARGATLDNTLVFDGSQAINPAATDEPVRHKALDLLGDLALLGARLQARVQARRPGHAFMHRALRALRDDLHPLNATGKP